MVIGLGLCPFADRPNRAGTIRFAVCASATPSEVLLAVVAELQHLVQALRSETETTLLIVPALHPDFLDFNDFVGEVEAEIHRLDLTGSIQVVGFHPRFQFAGVHQDAPENYTNRSPHPMLHLLREVSVTEVSEQYGDLTEIPKRNTQTLRRLGTVEIFKRLKPN